MTMIHSYQTEINKLFYFIRLTNLQFLSMNDNKLEELPFELCALSNLGELHIANNQLMSLPLEFGYLINLEKLHLQKNKIKELPEVCSINCVINVANYIN